MAKFNWVVITKEDVIRAIERFLVNNPEYPEPRSTFLLYDGKKLPAKHIRGMAYQEHFGVEIKKSDFGGGMETVRFFERLGFETDYFGSSKGNIKTKEIKKEIHSKKKTIEPKVQINNANTEKKQTQISDDKMDSEKIVIPAKQVIEQKNALQLILNRMFNGDIVCEKTYPWLKTPEKIDGIYKNLYDALSSYRGDTSFAKKNVTLRCDFVCESQKLIIEYDERQHFSEARRISLEAYKEIDVLYDRSLWIKACCDVKAKDNSPINRDEIRAYYDSTRDIACYENGYKLVRIMHGQIDFEASDAEEKLKDILNRAFHPVIENHENEETEEINTKEKASSIKVAMYLQTNELKNKNAFEKILPVMKKAAADIIVFPEYCYVPFEGKMTNKDIALIEDQDDIFAHCLELSKQIGKAVIVSSHDKYDTIFSVFANANPLPGETDLNLYIKHTMCGSSCLEFEQYPEIAGDIFNPILYKGYLIGMGNL